MQFLRHTLVRCRTIHFMNLNTNKTKVDRFGNIEPELEKINDDGKRKDKKEKGKTLLEISDAVHDFL